MKSKAPIVVLGFILLLSASASAQISVDTGIQNGYAWNIFKNPDSMVEAGQTLNRSELWKNSSYNEVFLNMDYLKDWGESRLKISVDAETNLYHQEKSAQKNSYEFGVSYRTNYARRKYFEIAPEYTRRQQDGVDQSDLVFSTRLSYQQFEVPVHLDFYLGERAWLKLESKYRYRLYDEFESSQTSYQAYYLEGLYKKRWDGNIISTTIEFIGEMSYRMQQSENLGIQTQQEDLQTRDFFRVDAGAVLGIATVRDNFEIEFPITWTYFLDRPTQQLNYTEIEVGTETSFYVRKSRINLGIDRSIRNFINYTIDDGSLLEYGFWTASASLRVPLSNRIYFEMKGQYQLRDSNRSRQTTSAYRSYETSYVQTGIRVEL